MTDVAFRSDPDPTSLGIVFERDDVSTADTCLAGVPAYTIADGGSGRGGGE